MAPQKSKFTMLRFVTRLIVLFLLSDMTYLYIKLIDRDAMQKQFKHQFSQLPSQPVKRWGGNFSVNHARWVHNSGDWHGILRQQLALGLKVIRVSLPWKDTEPQHGHYNWQEIDEVLNVCAQNKVSVILCVGVKTPRYPEVYLPEWCRDRALSRRGVAAGELNTTTNGIEEDLLAFVQAVVTRYDPSPVVECFQIENEPLERVGEPSLSIPFTTLRKEVELAYQLTRKDLMVNFGAGLTGSFADMAIDRQRMLDQLLSLPVQRIGLDLYQKGFYRGWFGWPAKFEASDEHWWGAYDFVQQIKAAHIEPVIAEVQGDPWEFDPSKMNFHDPEGNQSLNPQYYREVLEKTKRLGCETVLLWGVDFQTACAAKGNHQWLDVTKRMIKKN